MPPAPPQKLLPFVQGLRALAAFFVAFAHIGHDAVQNGGDPNFWLAPALGFIPWGAGVDVFFVISGFVIVHASAPLFGTGRAGAITFLHRRFARIIPLYWIMSALFLVVLLLSRSAIHGDIGGPLYIAASFLFLPWPRPDGVMQPPLGLGWTLNYEMFFYAAFAPFLFLPRPRAVIAAILVLGSFVAIGHFHPFAAPQLAYWSNPIILEFCAGMVLAQLFAAGVTLPVTLRLTLPLLALTGLHLASILPAWRIVGFGVPAIMLVAAAALAPAPATLSRASRLLVRLGDASYAMYLVHPFIMRGFALLAARLHAHGEAMGLLYVAAGLAIAQACALLINGTLERHLNALLRRRRVRNVSIPAY